MKPIIIQLDKRELIPLEVKEILTTLHINGYEGYIVGGAVRSFVMGFYPHDFDIVTNASTQKVKDLFPTSCFVGESFGVSLVKGISGKSYEVASYRYDGVYKNGRTPEEIKYASTLEEDLSRRDFTMNALVYDIRTNEILDYFNGVEDITKKIIRCIGNPFVRLVEEDYLRMLRAIRFASQYDMNISTDVLDCIMTNRECINKISIERIREELNKVLVSNHAVLGINLLRTTKILDIIIPEIVDTYNFNQNNPYHWEDVFNHTLSTLIEDKQKLNLSEDETLLINLALLFHDIGKTKVATVGEDGFNHYRGHAEESCKKAFNILTRLKYSKNITDIVCTLIKFHDSEIPASMRSLRRLIANLGSTELFELWKVVLERDTYAHSDFNNYFISYKEKIKKLEELYIQYCSEGKVYSEKDLDINGYDLMALGFEGRKIGEVQQKLLQMFLEGEINNSKEAFLKYLKRC